MVKGSNTGNNILTHLRIQAVVVGLTLTTTNMDNKENTRVFLNRLVMAAIFIIIWAGLTYRLLKTGFDMGFSTIWIFSLVLFFQVFMFWAGRTLYRFAKSEKGQQRSADASWLKSEGGTTEAKSQRG